MHTLRDLTEKLHGHGDAPAVISFDATSSSRWTYAELADRMELVAERLGAEGSSAGDHVAIIGETTFGWIATALALLHSGSVVVPIDAQLGDDEVDRILRDSGAALVVAGPKQVDRIESLGAVERGRVVALEELTRANGSRGAAHGTGASQSQSEQRAGHGDAPQPEDRAVLFYTSGTTGPSKGVPLTHENLTYQLRTVRAENLLAPDDRLLLPLPTHHVYPFVVGILIPLSYAIPVILPHSRTGPELVRAMSEAEATALLGVPRLYRALVDALTERLTGGRGWASAMVQGLLDTSYQLARWGYARGKLFFRPLHQRFAPDLRLMASGGAPLDAELERRLVGLGWKVAIGYGATETSPLLTIRRPGEVAPGTVGTPIEGTELRIDPDAAPDMAKGPESAGEVQARGPGVFGGYHELPEKTQGTFTQEGWFRTGDLGYFDDHDRLTLLGRASTLLVTEGGENVQPTEVEEHYAANDAIREIGVLQRDGDIVAVAVPEPRNLLADQEPREAVREAVRERSEELPSYQRVSEVAIASEPLPRTRLGDLRRHLLQERYERAQQSGAEGERGPISIEEMKPADRELLEDPAAREVWDILCERYPDRRVTPDTSPRLGLGIDSLAWVDLTLELERRAGVRLTEEAVQRVETVRDLMEEAAEASGDGAVKTEASDRDAAASPLEDPESMLGERERVWLEARGPAESVAASAIFAVVDKMMRLVFRLEVVGLENVPNEPVVFAPNHVSYMDPFALSAALPGPVLEHTQWAGSENVMFGNPLMRLAARLAWTVPVEPRRAAGSSLALGAAALERGRNLVWFPEGRRSPDGSLRPFTAGIGKLVDATEVPVVPVLISGTEKALPVNAFWPRPTEQVRVTFGSPARAEQLAAEGSGRDRARRIASGLRGRVRQLRDEKSQGHSSSGG